MKKTAIALIAATFAAVILGACTDNSGDTSQNNVLESQQQALERAKNVESDVAQAARRQAEEIERSEGGG